MNGRVTLTLAAAAATLLGASAHANDFTGRELQSQSQAEGSSRIQWRGEVGYRWLDRTFDTQVSRSRPVPVRRPSTAARRGSGSLDLNSHELGGKLTGTYRNWFVTGGYSHSISSDDVFGADTDTWGASVTGGYQFHLNRNFTVAPFLGWSWSNTSLDGAGSDADLGLGGLNFGLGFKWTPGYRAGKSFPKWSVFGSFAYFPSLDVSDDIEDAGFDGDNGWLATVGVEHNFSARTFANVYYQYGNFSGDGPFGADFKQRDHRIGVSAGLRF